MPITVSKLVFVQAILIVDRRYQMCWSCGRKFLSIVASERCRRVHHTQQTLRLGLLITDVVVRNVILSSYNLLAVNIELLGLSDSVDHNHRVNLLRTLLNRLLRCCLFTPFCLLNRFLLIHILDLFEKCLLV